MIGEESNEKSPLSYSDAIGEDLGEFGGAGD